MSAAYTPSQPGAVYVMTNQLTGNAVVAFTRAADGTLTMAGTFPTGGLGNGMAGTVDPLMSQSSLILSADNRFLFAVNALSNDISVLAIDEHGLTLVDKVASGGMMPVSLTHRDGLLYVLNAVDGTITSFIQNPDGTLTPLDGSTQTLIGGPTSAPAQVAFTPDGSLLVATEKATNVIDTFAVDADGRAGPPMRNESSGQIPFGFAIAREDLVIVSEAGSGAASSYRIDTGGTLKVISGSVPSNQIAPCWVAVNDSANPRYAYTSNTGSNSLSGYAIGDDGALSLLNADGVTAVTNPAPIDSAVADSRFLYVIADGSGNVDAFQIEPDGSLTPITGVSGLPLGLQGIAAY